MRMNSLFLMMTCFAVMATGAKACCLPDKFSMDFAAEIHKDDYQGDTAHETEVYDISGSFGADFENERFRLHYSDHKRKTSTTWFFDFAKGEYVYHHRVSTDVRSETCRIHPLTTTGHIDKGFKCILGNRKLVKRTNKNYQMVLANVAKLYGHLDINEENCQFFGKQVLAIILGSDKYVQARIDVLEVKTFGIKLVAPCSEGWSKNYGIEFPSVDELSTMRSESLTAIFNEITQFLSTTDGDVEEDEETSATPATSEGNTNFSGMGHGENDYSGYGQDAVVSEDDEPEENYYEYGYDASADGEGQSW